MATPRLGHIPEHIWTAILAEAERGRTANELVTTWAPIVLEKYGYELTWDEVATRIRREELKKLPPPPKPDVDAFLKWLEDSWNELSPEDIASLPPGGGMGFLDKRCPNRPKD